MAISYLWRGEFTNEALSKLHAEAFRHKPLDIAWCTQVNRHSLGWVCAVDGSELVGFVNVAWDGGVHAFLVDTIVAPSAQRQGIATRMVAMAVREAKKAGCQWLHVDFDAHLRQFYFDNCGFQPTEAGVIKL
jgi:GNAT superfamily N-acetyltransferase